MQLTFTVWIESLNTCVDDCLSLHNVFFVTKYCSPFVTCFFCNKPKFKSIHSCNHSEHYTRQPPYLKSTKKDRNSVQCILSGLYKLVVVKKRIPVFSRANHWLGQLQTPQSLTVLYIQSGARNVIPLIVHVTHFYYYKNIWHLIQN